MNQKELSIELPGSKAVSRVGKTTPEQARLRRPVRNQVEMILRDLDSLVPEEHPVRAIWEYLGKLDLSSFYSSIKAVLDTPGRPASDPRVLLVLWVYATIDDVGSARRLDRLCKEHDTYRWLCGGVTSGLSHTGGLSCCPSRSVRQTADRDYCHDDESETGHAKTGCPGWDAGKGWRRGRLVSPER